MQSAPIAVPSPIDNVGMNDGTSADPSRPMPITANALIVAVGSTVASAATDASGCTPAAGGVSGDSTCAARANVRYGDVLRITAHGAAASRARRS